ncbi:MAG TPA: molybdate ABC transporter substrate-binding protein [Solirubrobacteraceae bacterium]|nr:molybdate ABC transporter substrate-binding protein [Solirubrobacteraceae bacterium]
MRRAAALAAALALAGCGGDDEKEDALVVSAASSLQTALKACTKDADPPVRLQFGGSDELAAQIRTGLKPDVFAAANTKLPEQLAQEGLLEGTPTVFATNRLVVAAARDAGIDGLDDLEKEGVRIAIGSEGVPIGDYTRELLGRLDRDAERAILANVRSEEPDVKGIVGKLALGAADAGFVYVTDTRAAGLDAIALPEGLQPEVSYGAGVVKGSGRTEDAGAFVDGLTSGKCGEALADAGFGRPPA